MGESDFKIARGKKRESWRSFFLSALKKWNGQNFLTQFCETSIKNIFVVKIADKEFFLPEGKFYLYLISFGAMPEKSIFQDTFLD